MTKAELIEKLKDVPDETEITITTQHAKDVNEIDRVAKWNLPHSIVLDSDTDFEYDRNRGLVLKNKRRTLDKPKT